MSPFGTAGPHHARKQAQLCLFDMDVPSHRFVRKMVEVDATYQLFIAIPRTEPPKAGWPILYMMDGNAAFDFLTPDVLALAPNLVLVGVGYDSETQFARVRRSLDYTAPKGAGDGLRQDVHHPGRTVGGAALFLNRLCGPLRDAAETDLSIDPRKRTLWGHSFGALFTLYALLSRPDAFARFAAASPSIWWDEELIRNIATKAPFLPNPPPLLAFLGDKEKRSNSAGPPPDGPPADTLRFLTDLRRHPGLSPELHILPGLRHIETLAASFPKVLPFACT